VGEKLGYIKATLALALQRPDLAGPLRDYLQHILQQETFVSREAAADKE